MLKKYFSQTRKIFTGLVIFAGLLALLLFAVLPLPGQVPILMYHFIGTKQDTSSGNFVTLKTFEKQMAFLKRFGYKVISLEDFDAIYSGNKKPRGREIVITFDDGNQDAIEKTLPILKSFGYPATLFLISQNLLTQSYGSISAESAKQLLQNPLVHFGAHSRTHPFLPQASDSEVQLELSGSKKELESLLGIPINYFAYPYGDFDGRSLAAAQAAGYRLAFTTSPKKLKSFAKSDYCLPRVKISENASNLFIYWIKVSGIYEAFKLWRHSRYHKTTPT